MFRFALSKGRILEDTLPLLEKLGIELGEDLTKTRKLVIPARMPANPSLGLPETQFEMFVLRATDVPTFVQHGTADFGFVGKDVLLEHGADGIYELLDLHIAKCRLVVAEMKSPFPRVPGQPLRVATKFVKIARDYYASKGEQVKLIKLYGSMELAPLVQLADKIVDIVDTGNTLQANGLQPTEHIADISTRLIANGASYRRNYQEVTALVQGMRELVAQEQKTKQH